MLRLQVMVVFAGLVLSVPASGRAQADASGDAPITQRAALVLNYPHDKHVFAELPPDLTPVPGAVAQLTRGSDQIHASFRTKVAPRHVGKLLAVVINNPSACKVATPATACGPHEEEFNAEADGGFYLGEGAVAGADGTVMLAITVRAGDTGNVLCGGAANPEFDSCQNGFALRDPRQAEVTLVLLDNGPASDEPTKLERQLVSARRCPSCPPFTQQIAIGFGEPSRP